MTALVSVILLSIGSRQSTGQAKPFHLLEATVDDIHNAYKSGKLTAHQLVRLYLDRIEAFDKKGPAINAIIALNPKALEEADRLDAAFKTSGLTGPPFKSREEMLRSPDFEKVSPISKARVRRPLDAASHYQYLIARDELMTIILKIMADNKLDAIVFKGVEHQPTPIKDGVNPPYRNQWGVPDLNTFLAYVPAIVVPAGFTSDNLPSSITFMGRPYDDGLMIKLAYAYEQATHNRRLPSSTPQLSREP